MYSDRPNAIKTHKVSILKASHWPLKDGDFDTEIIFSAYYDFWKAPNAPNREAIMIFDSVAELLLYRGDDTINWEFEISISAKHFLGRSL